MAVQKQLGAAIAAAASPPSRSLPLSAVTTASQTWVLRPRCTGVATARRRCPITVGGLGWITSLRAPAVRALVEGGALQLSLFDEQNLAEITDHPDYPGERLVACRSPALAAERARKRLELLAATERLLEPIAAAVGTARLVGADKIGVRVGRAVNRYKMAKHLALTISDTSFGYLRKAEAIAAEAALDGIYVIRASAPHTTGLDPPAVVIAYKDLAFVERGFRNLKAIDLDLRPIHHWTEQRVRAHVFICMLALYLVWHLRHVWTPMCFTDEQPPRRTDPVGPAQRSPAALAKASRHHDADGEAIHSLATLLDELGTLTRNTIVFAGGTRITKLATPTSLQTARLRAHRSPIPIQLSTK